MKNNFLFSGLVAVLLTMGCSNAARSADTGVLTVTAKITSPTCSIDINGLSDATVTLPTVQTTDFPATGAMAGSVKLTLNLKNCADVSDGTLGYKITPAKAFTERAGFEATAGSATGIGFVYYNSWGRAVTFTDKSFTFYPSLENGTFTAEDSIKYISTQDKVTAGTVSTTLQYTIIYK